MHGLKTCDVIIANKVASGRTTSSPGVTAPRQLTAAWGTFSRPS
jgi:hypothetical protein